MENNNEQNLEKKGIKFSFTKKIASVISFFFLIITLCAIIVIVSLLTAAPSSKDQTVVIPAGSSVAEIASILEKQELITSELVFKIVVLLKGSVLKAGEYAIPARSTVMQAAQIIHDGKTVPRFITIPEGLTVTEIYRIIDNAPVLTGELSIESQEGELLPETYRYDFGDSKDSIVKRMKADMNRKISGLWEKRDTAIPVKSIQEAVILASIVEKETGFAAERNRVAGVFHNRLKKGMPLQSDPTVIYAITKGQGAMEKALLRSDLSVASPFNTYMVAGLPPHPICNPGELSLKAVLNPEEHGFLYFVADGSGGHAFATTLEEHNRNVAEWRKINARQQ
ncbi:MAG: endolytic transglycosylase MltG [Alphaproteobacteria bacterium]|nr:endolytic transglycosylase MltG [Alphaproteobacteria bacterium]MCL2505536.1 endolytic transglycosylase MltG [Alphaproteobacteria bacterium]